MFGIGLPELIVILGLALIVVGPEKLPDLARSIAKGILELKKTAEGVKEGLTKEGSVFEDLRPDLDAVKILQKELAETTDIDWKKDFSVEKQDATTDKTGNSEASSTELMATPSTITPKPVDEGTDDASVADTKTVHVPNHHS